MVSAISAALFRFYRERRIIGKNRPDTDHNRITTGFEPINTGKVLRTRYPDLPALTCGNFTVSAHCNIDYDLRAHIVPFLPGLLFQPTNHLSLIHISEPTRRTPI